jgi:hypothetical protein
MSSGGYPFITTASLAKLDDQIISSCCRRDTDYSPLKCNQCCLRPVCVCVGAVMSHYLSKSFVFAFLCGAVSSGLGGCSIHPVPKDVTGYETATIVRKIRCEARDAIREAALEIVRKDHRHAELAALTDEIDSVHKIRGTNRWEQERLTDLERIGIVYDFSLEGVETDGATFNADVLKPLKNGSELFSPSLADTLKRDNTRTFTISDSFSSLLKLSEKHCNFLASGPNYQYPIGGRIGLDEMIRTFVRLSVSGDLIPSTSSNDSDKSGTTSGQKSADLTDPMESNALATTPKPAPAKSAATEPSDAISPSGSPTMVDTLIFTTTVSAGLTPKITLTPVGSALQLQDATFTGTVSRVDTHTVTISMALGNSPANLSPSAAVAVLSPKTTALFVSHHSKDPGTSGEKLALQALVQDIIRRDLLRRGGGSIAIGLQ